MLRDKLFLKLFGPSLLIILLVTVALDVSGCSIWKASLVALLALLLSALNSAWYARAFSKHVDTLGRMASTLAAGDFSARVDRFAVGELAPMAEALNAAAASLAFNFDAMEHSRAQLETVLDSMQEGVLAITADKRIGWQNGTMSKLIGVPPKPGARLTEALHDPDILSALEHTLATGEVRTEKSQLLVPGRSFQITTASMPGGGAVAVLQEITEIEQVEKTRRDFIANVSHELRTPLTSIQGYAETLLDSIESPHGREYLEIIRKNADRMNRLTIDLLALARVESGEDRLHLEPRSAMELIEESIHSFADIARVSRDIFKKEVRAQQSVRADADKVDQVFANLFENACKYGSPESGITVGARDAKDEVEFFVRDSGKGIPSEHLPRIFERLYRVDSSRQSGGTGLGLAIAKHIVLKHGGRIWAESELGRGTTVLFTLPTY